MKFTDFNRIPGFIAAFRPFLGDRMGDAGKETYEKMISEWERGNDAKGRSWEPLAPSTISQKGHSTPLIETRDMIESASYEYDPKNLQVGIQIDSEYAAVHEFGAPDQGIPARPILSPTVDVLADQMNPVIGNAIDRAYTSAGASGLGMKMGMGALSGGGVR